MLIQCTKKLLNELKIKPTSVSAQEDRPLFSWHANIVTISRKKTVVLMNDSNRYVIVLHGLKAKDFTRIEQIILDAIREVFRNEQIKEEVIDRYLSEVGAQIFTGTKDRASVTKLNKACEHVFFNEDMLVHGSLIQAEISKKASRFLVGKGKSDYGKPNEDLYQDLEQWMGTSIFSTEAVVLHVTLDLDNHHVWRKVVVPKAITFPGLHKVLQILFGWQDSHHHEFSIYQAKPAGLTRRAIPEDRKPVSLLVCSEEALHYDSGIPMKMETGEKLSEYLPAEIVYSYDFGDGWRHLITVEQFIDDYNRNVATCLGGEGNAPPEDVGGEWGYDEFLAIISDKQNPDYEQMREWGRYQGYEEFNLELLNRKLKDE
ncbi:plasmid pRiA4b ORF-3 family protein [Halalkalibacter akibai]|uniref:Uncharacterized protein n=1 Tax=Halalkalibacter akibai (strain ATCC 43226 / DSM 21942 / CIP 109018 / JCM 9157 / 1139) TaxID=1236973 RepID=W4QSH4_HALA3|nr:plasmid pRiA4b ORF-3 family protein [Halalkalibacter akibai]GAE35036.1 hypothetical protein JCM9157_2129 [Halalkalibacter akibai JCM 9157]